MKITKRIAALTLILLTSLYFLTGCTPDVIDRAAGLLDDLSGTAAYQDTAQDKTPGTAQESCEDGETKTLRIIGTSDLHGKFFPWDYALDEENSSGSLAQLSSAIKEFRTEDTLLFDAGDTIQDNYADIFIGDEDVHPMIQGMNAMNYDVWVTGNHEYNFGLDITKKTIADFGGRALVGNVYDEAGKPLSDGYTIISKNGVRVAVIGMVTPAITRWDAANLAGCTVTDALEETRKILEKIKGQYDVLIGVFHMGINRDFNMPNSGVTDILNACPEFDLMISSHEHQLIPSEYINDVLVVQNKNMAQTMAVVDLTLEKDGDGWEVKNRSAESVEIAGFAPDPEITDLLEKYDAKAREDARKVVGRLEGGPLAPENEIAEIPTAQIEDTAFIDLINKVQMHYSGAKVSSAALFSSYANLYPGDIRKCDVSLIYKYSNSLYKLKMTGAQLKKYMEWSAKYYNTYQDGDLTISFNPDMRIYLYDMFEGVNYEINVANKPGHRIENLTWPDGTPVKDEEEFEIAVNNYRADSFLLSPDGLYKGEALPEVLETDIRGDIGGIRELIADYIVNEKGGIITPECNYNWKITGNDWDPALHEKAVKELSEGKLTISSSEDGRTLNVRAVRVEDL
ncbi:MAG: 5'-nucleotidase C-terminal domain-containing protein [Lachnospiraceae bacterium]|nr:5'-nucleotidase C-terminal domain-containing protein [Lachnospiraceae bacterium]